MVSAASVNSDTSRSLDLEDTLDDDDVTGAASGTWRTKSDFQQFMVQSNPLNDSALGPAKC